MQQGLEVVGYPKHAAGPTNTRKHQKKADEPAIRIDVEQEPPSVVLASYLQKTGVAMKSYGMSCIESSEVPRRVRAVEADFVLGLSDDGITYHTAPRARDRRRARRPPDITPALYTAHGTAHPHRGAGHDRPCAGC